MKEEIFRFKDGGNIRISVYKWMPEEGSLKGIIQLVHGMAEHAARYKYFAEKLCSEGYGVYAHDQRGHGKTAKGSKDLGYAGDKDGFDWMIEDIYQLNQIIRKQQGNLPIILFGHNLGSFLAQRYIQLHRKSVNAVIMSGSNGPMGGSIRLGIVLSGLIMKLKGRKYKSTLLNTLNFSGYNTRFKPNRTNFDWISANEKNVDEYIKDHYCGFLYPVSFYYDFYRGLKERQRSENIEKVPKDKPILIISGSMDPVGGYSKGAAKLYDTYKNSGIINVEKKIYERLRHEVLMEERRDDVIKDIIDWITVQTAAISIIPDEKELIPLKV